LLLPLDLLLQESVVCDRCYAMPEMCIFAELSVLPFTS